MSTNIIALRGVGSSGKTTTIRILYDLLRQNGYVISYTDFKPSPSKDDYFAIFERNGKRIGVTSRGDTYDLVSDALADMSNENCDIYVCACRTYDRLPPGTNAAINEIKGGIPKFISKQHSHNKQQQLSLNRIDAATLFQEIDILV